MLAVLSITAIIHLFCLLRCKRWDRPFLGVLLFSHIYFCWGAYFYWVGLQQAYFVGMEWVASDVNRAILTLSAATTAVAVLADRVFTLKTLPRDARTFNNFPLVTWLFLAIGLIASLFVISLGIIAGAKGSARGDFFLVAYQASDLLIPVLLFAVAKRGPKLWIIGLLVYFVVYASMVGFRYKIALVAIPLLAMLVLSNLKLAKKVVYIAVLSLTTLILFSALTLFRTKFGGLDFSPRDRTFTDVLYGFFAESNIIFGLTTIITDSVDAGDLHPVAPVVDIFKEWIPRFLLPNRTTGEYLQAMQYGFHTEQGIASGTAYPYIGEFGIMGGWFGMVLGAVLYAYWYGLLRNKILTMELSRQQVTCGLGLLAAVMGYYHFSRGYLPQIAKAYIFVVIPYLFLCARNVQPYLRKSYSFSRTP